MRRGDRSIIVAASALLLALLCGMVGAAIAGGVNWFVGVAAAGTALGTLGLAFWTWRLASRTTESVEASNRLAETAEEDLRVGREQAKIAEGSRIDALAPALDVYLDVVHVEHQEKSGAAWRQVDAGTHLDGAQIELGSVRVTYPLVLSNAGRTPAYVEPIEVAAPLPGAPGLIRVDGGPGNAVRLRSYKDWTKADPLCDPRQLRYEFTVTGPLTRETLDRVEWTGEIRLLLPEEGGYRVCDNPLRPLACNVDREYPDEVQRERAGATRVSFGDIAG